MIANLRSLGHISMGDEPFHFEVGLSFLQSKQGARDRKSIAENRLRRAVKLLSKNKQDSSGVIHQERLAFRAS
jgi:hypothetical protein